MRSYRIENKGNYVMTATVKDDQTGSIKVVIKGDGIEPNEIIEDFKGLLFEVYDHGIVNAEGERTDYNLRTDFSKKTISVKIKSHECFFEDKRVVSEFSYNLGRILRLGPGEVSA